MHDTFLMRSANGFAKGVIVGMLTLTAARGLVLFLTMNAFELIALWLVYHNYNVWTYRPEIDRVIEMAQPKTEDLVVTNARLVPREGKSDSKHLDATFTNRSKVTVHNVRIYCSYQTRTIDRYEDVKVKQDGFNTLYVYRSLKPGESLRERFWINAGNWTPSDSVISCSGNVMEWDKADAFRLTYAN